MPDVTSTSFGLVIAYLLPGLAGFYTLSLWSHRVDGVLNAFATANSTFGLSLLVVLASLTIGMILTIFEWLIYQKTMDWFRSKTLGDMTVLGKDSTKLAAFRALADEHYRYHQFYAGMTIVIPFLFAGWEHKYWQVYTYGDYLLALAAVLTLEGCLAAGAAQAYRFYVDRGGQILKA